MDLRIFPNADALSESAASFCQKILGKAIATNGMARIILSTGNSQLRVMKSLVTIKVDWSKVEMFHLDEYLGIPESHPASFRKYLKQQFISHVSLKQAYLIDADDDAEAVGKALSAELLKRPVDLALIGIGENAHVAFNDPPADFDTQEPYIRVKLSDACKRQQVREGWFAALTEVPDYAISMSVHRIMQSKVILSCVPYRVKAEAVKRTMESPLTNMVPATILRMHPDWHLYLDADSASSLTQERRSI